MSIAGVIVRVAWDMATRAPQATYAPCTPEPVYDLDPAPTDGAQDLSEPPETTAETMRRINHAAHLTAGEADDETAVLGELATLTARVGPYAAAEITFGGDRR